MAAAFAIGPRAGRGRNGRREPRSQCVIPFESMPVTRPAPIRTDGSNAFAAHTMRERVPAILERAASDQATGTFADRLRRLRAEVVENAPIRLLEPAAPDRDTWNESIAPRRSEYWLATDWFFAETYLYRRAIEAVEFFGTNADPFAVTKHEELGRKATWDFVEAARSLDAKDREARLMSLLEASVFGNRMDSSYVAAAAQGTSSGDLLVDDRAKLFETIFRPAARVDIVLDNAGTELLVDLVLATALTDFGVAKVVLHAKSHPTFVSDATRADVGDAIKRLGGDVEKRAGEGRLVVTTDLYWTSPRFFDEAPAHVVAALAGSDLAFVKGDANYRRLVGDAVWDPSTPSTRATGPLPCTMFALRALKSDTIVGLKPGQADLLDRESPTWRVDGKRGIAQLLRGYAGD